MPILKLLHVLSAVVWVGGMFFAYMVLRPTAVEVLQPPERLRLWDGVFRRFFVWVWAAVAVILVSGLGMIHLYGGMAHVPLHVHVMFALGLAMMAIYAYVFFACYRPLAQEVAGQRWKEAGALLGRIRQLVGLNLVLGLLTVGIAALGVALG